MILSLECFPRIVYFEQICLVLNSKSINQYTNVRSRVIRHVFMTVIAAGGTTWTRCLGHTVPSSEDFCGQPNLETLSSLYCPLGRDIWIHSSMFTGKFNITKVFILSKSINLLQFQSRSKQDL